MLLWLLKLVSVLAVGTWSVLRGIEEGIGIWVRRAARPRDLSGVSWA